MARQPERRRYSEQISDPRLVEGLNSLARYANALGVAEQVGFEPTVGLPPRRFSRPLP